MTQGTLRLSVVTLAVAVGGAGCSSGAGASADAGGPPPDAGPEGPPPTLNVARDLVGIVGTGQSLAVGDHGTPVLATQPQYNNLKLAFGGATVAPPFDPAIPSLELVPLTEPLRTMATTYPSGYPANLYGETPHTAMATQITALAMQAASLDYVTVHTVVGESGQPMTVIRKNPANAPGATGGRAYAATLFEAAAITRLAGAMGKTYGIGAIVLTHGESDAGNTSYANALYQMFTDYNQDLAAITGQTAKIPLLASQQNSVPAGGTSISALQVWQASIDHPGEIVCTGPKYQYSYATDSAHVHLSAREYERLGEKTAQVYFERVVLGRDWQPLQPMSATVSGNAVTVSFHVPVPPLVWDDTLPAPHGTLYPEWAQGRGFEVTAAGARQTIASVQIVGNDTVKITCSGALPAGQVVVAYALTAGGGTLPAAQPARWGHLRDSDPFVGAMTATAQPNYCVAFQITAN
jgi:hypothetical protein